MKPVGFYCTHALWLLCKEAFQISGEVGCWAITQMRGVEESATDDKNDYGVQQEDSGQKLEGRVDCIY